jgi:hypothetical protein
VCVSERGVLSTPPRTPTSRRCSERSGGVELEARGPLQTEQAVARGELARLRDEAAALRASMAREQTELQQDSAAVRAAVSREQAQLDAARSAHHTQLAAVHAAQVRPACPRACCSSRTLKCVHSGDGVRLKLNPPSYVDLLRSETPRASHGRHRMSDLAGGDRRGGGPAFEAEEFFGAARGGGGRGTGACGGGDGRRGQDRRDREKEGDTMDIAMCVFTSTGSVTTYRQEHRCSARATSSCLMRIFLRWSSVRWPSTLMFTLISASCERVDVGGSFRMLSAHHPEIHAA